MIKRWLGLKNESDKIDEALQSELDEWISNKDLIKSAELNKVNYEEAEKHMKALQESLKADEKLVVVENKFGQVVTSFIAPNE